MLITHHGSRGFVANLYSTKILLGKIKGDKIKGIEMIKKRLNFHKIYMKINILLYKIVA